jgi:hypothetical protein
MQYLALSLFVFVLSAFSIYVLLAEGWNWDEGRTGDLRTANSRPPNPYLRPITITLLNAISRELKEEEKKNYTNQTLKQQQTNEKKSKSI